MSRWWRAYDEAVNDPKLQLLSDHLFRAWFNLMCIASQHEGKLPAIDSIAFTLRVKPEKAAAIISQLHKAGLLDKTETGFEPHNWNGRQYKSDVSTERVKRFRNGKRNVSVTPPDTEAETEQITEAKASDAPSASVDHRKRLFDEGLPKLAAMTGKGPDACRSFVGKCLKAAGDDAVTVLGLIEEAERNQVVDPSAWIAVRLKSPVFSQGNANAKRTVHDAARDLAARVRALDEPAPGLCDGSGGSVVRMLPAR
jgi:hypothetical protein